MSSRITPEKPKSAVSPVRELAKQRWENPREFFALFDKVDNKVIFTNDDVLFPLKMKEGEPSPLGIFAEKVLSDRLKRAEQLSPEEKEKIVEVCEGHKRSALLARAIFRDKEDRLYRDIDVKGIGMIEWQWPEGKGLGVEISSRLGEPSGGGRGGLLDENLAFYDMQMSEEFYKAGIRTSRVLGIIRLNELIKDGKRISLEEARKGGIIDKEFSPVISVRAFGTKARVDELINMPSGDIEGRSLLLKDAQELVEQELGKKFSSTEEYLEWFAKTLGKNVGLCHKNHWAHGYLSGHNITLDCRIVDLDGVTKSRDFDDFKEDIADALVCLINVLRCSRHRYTMEVREKFEKLFRYSYLQAGGNEEAAIGVETPFSK